LLASLGRSFRRFFETSAHRKLRIKPLKDVAQETSATVFLNSDRSGYAELLPGGPVERRSSLDIVSHDQGSAYAALTAKFADRSYASTPISAVRLKDAYVDGLRGVCVTSDGIMIEEASAVARGIDPNLPHVVFVSMAHQAFIPGKYPVVEDPVLHCFHPASAAFGHFLFDVLPVLAFFRQKILDGRLKVLIPSFPQWGFNILKEMGISREHLIQLSMSPIICRNATIVSTMTTYNTFFPNPVLTQSPAKALGLDVSNRWENHTKGSRIYLSRANQNNYFNRSVENEDEVRATLAAMGFQIIEPSNLSFRDQISAIESASVIVGPHGSGFGNLMFARRNTAVIDLMPDDWVEFFDKNGTPERWLLNITNVFGLDYTVMLCRSSVFQALPEDDTSGLQKRGIKASVDTQALRRTIEGVLQT
jgi:capsular polysaccharide biosynthesis protein